jgi:hypothetical protein
LYSICIFTAENKNDISVGKYFIEFHVISDSDILTENRKSPNSQPDALDLEISAENAAEKVTNKINLFRDHLLDVAEAEHKNQKPRHNKPRLMSRFLLSN